MARMAPGRRPKLGSPEMSILSPEFQSMNRTFVARKGGVWYALPRPDLFPLLTTGLNQEPVTKNVVYQIK